MDLKCILCIIKAKTIPGARREYFYNLKVIVDVRIYVRIYVRSLEKFPAALKLWKNQLGNEGGQEKWLQYISLSPHKILHMKITIFLW